MADYNDIDLSFNVNPITQDVSKLTGSAAVMQSVREIVLTTPGEFQFAADVGGGVYKSLFNLRDTLTAMQTEIRLKQQIEQNCDEVDNVTVSVTSIVDDLYAVNIDVMFYVKNSPDRVDLTIPIAITN